jgi:hypothetical protein
MSSACEPAAVMAFLNELYIRLDALLAQETHRSTYKVLGISSVWAAVMDNKGEQGVT